MNGVYTCIFNGQPNLSDCTPGVPVDSSWGWASWLILALWLIGFFIIAVILISKSVRICLEYDRMLVFRFGKLRDEIRGPGLFLIIPIVDKTETVSLRIEANEIKQQEMITKDSISLLLSAVVFYRVTDPKAAIIEVEDYDDAVDQFSLTSFRNVIGACSLDEVLSDRQAVSDRARIMLDEVTEKWGVEIQRVEVKQIELPDSMKRAMAREAEATREKRARIIKSEGEKAAADNLSDAAETLSSHAGALELRRLQTLAEIGAEHNSTIIAMLPQELLMAAKAIAGG